MGPLLAHLNIGVTIFFLISGFLLYRPFIAHRNGGAAAPPVVQYAKRRFLRIYPAYWLVLTVLVIVPGLTGVGNGDVVGLQYGIVQTLPLPGAADCNGLPVQCGLAQTWSLVVEVTFYAALPLYVLAAAYLARGRSVRSWMRLELLVLRRSVGRLGDAPFRRSRRHGPDGSWARHERDRLRVLVRARDGSGGCSRWGSSAVSASRH